MYAKKLTGETSAGVEGVRDLLPQGEEMIRVTKRDAVTGMDEIRGRQNKFFKRCQLGLQTGLPLLRHFFHQPLDASWLTIHGKNVPSTREQFNSLCAIATAKVDGLQ